MTKLSDHFATWGPIVSDRWVVIWADEARQVWPFDGWTDDCPPGWWKAYNAVKHNRWANIRQATLANTCRAVAALFLAIARSPHTVEALAEEGWIHSRLDAQYAAAELANGNEDPQLTITIQSSLMSYVVGTQHPDFDKCVGLFAGRAHDRFSKWIDIHCRPTHPT